MGATTNGDAGAGSFYDRIAGLYNITFKFNGYGRSLDDYLRKHPLSLSTGARALDAGCGTGLLTLSLLRTLKRRARITAVDLSASSIVTARRAIEEHGTGEHTVEFAQANVLALPFADHSFELVVTSGVLEYVSLRDGFGELARVLAPGGYLIHLPVFPSPISKMLEVMFRFKTHPPREVTENTKRYFHIIKDYRFPPLHPIGWTKKAVLAQKV